MIQKPEQMDFSGSNVVAIVYGLPGVGKTTLAFSAPDVLLVDADDGVKRVNPEHRRSASIAKTYEEILADIKEAGNSYKTIVIDTGGALIDSMKDWAMRNEPSASKKSGGFSQQGYGFVKTEFLRLSAELRKKYHVIFLFHAVKDKQGDELFYDLVCEGSAKTMVWQPADLGAYMHIINGERYLGFTPTMNYNAKSAYGIKGLVKVPELKPGEPNDFLTKLFAQVKSNISAEASTFKPQKTAYDSAISAGQKIINGITTPDKAIPALDAIRQLPHALTSLKELEASFKSLMERNGWKYDAAKKSYAAAK